MNARGRSQAFGCTETGQLQSHAAPRHSTPPNATFGSQMARFPRPYCATEPVRTVPFFNLYDDIQITPSSGRSQTTLPSWTALLDAPGLCRTAFHSR